MNVLEAIALRHTVRDYRPDPVPEETLRRLVEAAHLAPSSWNLQPWEFVVVTDPGMKRALRAACNDQQQVEQAGAAIVCLGSMRQQDALADRIEATLGPDTTPEQQERIRRTVQKMRHDEVFRRSHVITNSYIAVAYLTLAAMEYGLGTCWMGSFDADMVRAVLSIPEEYVVVSVVSVGWPAAEPELLPHRRRPVEQVLRWNGF
ncbi:MAG TPA: nitroreductase family protein [Symbiobacteriaceae bacterium]|nr:nitroreductase family protein [Symbiobacteriaceae bacterium]